MSSPLASGAGGSADQSGARADRQPGGTVILWVTAVGLAALAIWLIVSAALSPSHDKKKKAVEIVTGLGKCVAYLAIGGTAVMLASGGSTDGESAIETLSAALIAAPGGIIALGVIGYVAKGIALAVSGVLLSIAAATAAPSRAAGLDGSLKAVVGLQA